MGHAIVLCAAIAVLELRRVALRTSSNLESGNPDIQRSHRAFRDFPSAVFRNQTRQRRTHFTLLQTFTRGSLQYATRGHRRRSWSVHQSPPHPLQTCPMHHGARNGQTPWISRLVSLSPHQMARRSSNRKRRTPAACSCCRIFHHDRAWSNSPTSGSTARSWVSLLACHGNVTCGGLLGSGHSNPKKGSEKRRKKALAIANRS